MNRIALRAAILIAAVYGYFLIFAQFSFIELIRAGGISQTSEKIILAAMAIGGISSGFFVAWRGVSSSWLKATLIVAAMTSALAPTLSHMPYAVLIGFLAGAALGVATVSLATLLKDWCGLFWVGLGTGIGYGFCNLPWVFQSNPSQQAYIACGLAVIGWLVIPRTTESPDLTEQPTDQTRSFWPMVFVFTALVWLDSAAFFIIQHVSEMRAETWGTEHLWRNSTLHFIAAILAGLWMKHANVRILPIAAWALLAVASLATTHSSTIALTGWLYPIGVSIYSAALIAWPAWFSDAKNKKQIGWRSAVLFGIAGWFGSANGIGMAQTLETVPNWFIIASGAIVISAIILTKNGSWRIAAVIGSMLTVFQLGNLNEEKVSKSPIERGKQVYLSEGCINCHSQYIRPDSSDEILWGKGPSMDEIKSQQPVLIGNRRQGPDLTNIGTRRSSTWLKQHFINPQAFAVGSSMPSYAHLFEDVRGDDLVAYLSSLGLERYTNRIEQVANWIPQKTKEGNDDEALFSMHCVVCHGADGRGNGLLASHFQKPPANLIDGPFIWSAAQDHQDDNLARIIKCGIPGTDMPGHETLSDQDISTLRAHVLNLRNVHLDQDGK
jgi:cytochrome c oxidase cbb3-type subunit 2